VVAVAPPTGTTTPSVSRSVTVIVTEAITVPNLVGMSKDSAQKVLSGYSLSLGKVTYQDTGRRETAGHIISQTPKAGTPVTGRLIDIVVASEDESSGDQLPVIVPNVVGMKVGDAMKRLSSLGLSPVVADDKSDDVVYAPVAGQSPPPGTKVAKATKVILYLKGR
jgi:eukaryotic-like serine/threonine-protein kinase